MYDEKTIDNLLKEKMKRQIATNKSLDILLDRAEEEILSTINLIDMIGYAIEDYKSEELFVNEEYIIRYKNLVNKIIEHYEVKLCEGKCSTEKIYINKDFPEGKCSMK